MRALLLAIATVSSLAVAAPTLAQTLTVNSSLSIDVSGFTGDPSTLPGRGDRHRDPELAAAWPP